MKGVLLLVISVYSSVICRSILQI